MIHCAETHHPKQNFVFGLHLVTRTCETEREKVQIEVPRQGEKREKKQKRKEGNKGKKGQKGQKEKEKEEKIVAAIKKEAPQFEKRKR